MKQQIFNYLKNISGWTTRRKILCFAVDDYGNIYLNSKESYLNLKERGVRLDGRFGHLDALDNREDFEQLYEVLDSVKDVNSKPANFTTYALPCNINFEKILKDSEKFEYELLPETYLKVSSEQKAYEGAWELLQEGINSHLITPQFHGREHLNVELFENLLSQKKSDLLINLENKSFAGLPKQESRPTVAYNQAFAFWHESEVELHKKIIKDGLNCFKEVYGFRSKTFTPPAQQLHPKLFSFIEEQGIKAIDKPRYTKRHLGQNKFQHEFNTLGIGKTDNHVTIVRNAVFEPNSNKNINWVDFTFKQVQAAFRMQKPAIISSHRVNFCGHISTENRKESLLLLKALLCKIVEQYPDVEFLSVDQLVEEIITTSSAKL
jgi:hypothetical protein